MKKWTQEGVVWAFGKGEDGRLGLDDEDPLKTFFRRCHICSVGLANAKADHDDPLRAQEGLAQEAASVYH